jgi:hypothetical protein
MRWFVKAELRVNHQALALAYQSPGCRQHLGQQCGSMRRRLSRSVKIFDATPDPRSLKLKPLEHQLKALLFIIAKRRKSHPIPVFHAAEP